MTDTFSTHTLKTVQIVKEIIQGTNYYEVTLQCRTSAYSEYSGVMGHAGICTVTPLLSGRTHVQDSGTKATLVLATTSYANCSIKDISAAEVQDSMTDVWDYTITFVQDTTT